MDGNMTEDAASNATKRPRLSDDFGPDRLARAHERSRSPPQIRRSYSMQEPSVDDEDSLLSPKRSATPISMVLGGRAMKKYCLRRSLSLPDVVVRKSLDFSTENLDDENPNPSPPRFPDRSLNGSEESLSSMVSTDTELSRQEEQENFAKWQTATKQLKRRRHSPASFDDSFIGSVSPSSPYGIPRSEAFDEGTEFVNKKMSVLDVSQTMAPPMTSSLFPRTVSRVANGPNDIGNFKSGAPAFDLAPFETPTREQSIINQCSRIDVSAVVDRCKSMIKLVVIDFDDTLIDIHTNGQWEHPSDLLCTRIRPLFRVLVPKLLRAGIPIGIATFSPQEEMIQSLMQQTFVADVRLGTNLFVRGYRKEDHFSNGEATYEFEGIGKRKHIECILSRVPQGDTIAPGQILFIDDDVNNTTVARQDGHRSVQFRDVLADEMFLKQCMTALS